MYPSLLSDFNETLIFSTIFKKMRKYQISWKSVQWEPICSMWTEGRTDTTKLIVAFRNFTKAPKKDRFASRQPLSQSKFQPQTHCAQVRICRQLTFSIVLRKVYKPCLKFSTSWQPTFVTIAKCPSLLRSKCVLKSR